MHTSSSSVLSTEAHYFAYKLGYISRFKIEREARKAEPRLHKLVGHCSLFDQARKYIIEHNEQQDVVDAEAVDKLSHEDSDEELEADIEHIESVAETPLSRQLAHQQRRGAVVVVRATEVPSGHVDDDLKWDDDDLEWDHDDDSDSTKTDDDDEISDDDNWSDSTCADDYGDGHPDGMVLEIYPAPQAKYLHQDDDLLLWSQQPQVLTQGQADSLLVEAFA